VVSLILTDQKNGVKCSELAMSLKLGRRGKVVVVVEGVPPCTMTLKSKSVYV